MGEKQTSGSDGILYGAWSLLRTLSRLEVEEVVAKGLSRRDRRKLNMERATERRAWHRDNMDSLGKRHVAREVIETWSW